MSIKLNLEGFDALIRQIEKANGKIEPIVENTMKASADVMDKELKTEMKNSNVPKNLINSMLEPKIESDHGRITAVIGYRKGVYNPHNLSAGDKVVFLNYGTPRRKKHGKIKDVNDGGKIKLGFIARAKKRATKTIKKQQQNALNEILEGLKK